VDFYRPEYLSSAKKQLLKDIGYVQSVSFRHVPQQRQDENRAVRDVDDMFALLMMRLIMLHYLRYLHMYQTTQTISPLSDCMRVILEFL